MQEVCKEIPNIYRLREYIGKTITYKFITELLEIKYYKGDSKTRQLNLIQQYFKLEKVKTKFKVLEEYPEPIPVVDNRQSVYYSDLETIILFALQNSTREVNTWSVTEALFVTSLVNNNYKIGKKDILITAEAIEVDKDYLTTFYQSIHSRFKSVFESTLKRMSNKKLIDYKEITMIYKRIPKIKLNDFGIPVIDDNGCIIYTTDKQHLEANESERKYILATEKQVLKSFKCDSISDLIKVGKYQEYKKEVNNVLKTNLNIEFYYKAYSIIHNKSDIEEEIDNYKSMFSTVDLNCLKLSALDVSKDKILNSNLVYKQLCIDILVDTFPSYNLKDLIEQYKDKLKLIEQQKKEKLLQQDIEDNIVF